MTGNVLIFMLILFPIICGVLSFVIGRFGRSARDIFVIIVTFLELAGFVALFAKMNMEGAALTGAARGYSFVLEGFCGLGLSLKLDGFRIIYCLIACFMWAMTALLSRQYFAHYNNENRYYLFFLMTLGATLGVLASGDLYTTFIFFEMMSFTSYTWVTQDEKPEAIRAAETYLAIAVIGGLVMLMGIFMLYHELGTVEIDSLYAAASALEDKRMLYIIGACMLFGFGAKAGAFPLHIWLPKAHPVAPAPASALLSGVLTKSGVYGVLVITCHILRYDPTWASLILTIGVLTMVGGAVLALFSIDLKRTLACSSVSQIGFILVGTGMIGLLGEENMLAVHGAFLHMVNHSLFKLLLFMCAGVVFMNLHKLDLNEIQGFGRKKYWLNLCFIIGALGIGGIPGFNGYVSKTLIHESIVEYKELLEEGLLKACWYNAEAMTIIEWVFLISGGMTVAYMTKLYICLFVRKNNDEEKQKQFDENKGYMNIASRIAILLPAAIMPVMGIGAKYVMDTVAKMAESFMAFEGESESVNYFSAGNLKGGLISICIGAAIYVLFINLCLMPKNQDGKREYKNFWPQWLDIENAIYRPLLLVVLPSIFGFVCRIFDSLVDTIVVILRKTLYKDSPLPQIPVEGNVFTRTLGSILNAFTKKNGKAVDYKHRLAINNEKFNANIVLIKRSMSYGLALFCAGLMVTIIYLLLVDFTF